MQEVNKRGLRKRISDALDQSSDNDRARIRAQFLDDWAEYCNCPRLEDGKYDYSKIDYENPHVKLEYALCNPYTLRLCASKNPEKKARGIARLPEDVRDLYMAEYDGKIDMSPRNMVKVAAEQMGLKKKKAE